MIVESVRHPLLPRAIICVLLGVISALQSCETKILEDNDVVAVDVEDGADAIASVDIAAALDGDGPDIAVEEDTVAECPTSAVCPTAGARCVADDLILCSEDASGCLQA